MMPQFPQNSIGTPRDVNHLNRRLHDLFGALHSPCVPPAAVSFAWLSQTIARLEPALQSTPPLLQASAGAGAAQPHVRVKRSVGFFHEVRTNDAFI
jgi:hypothetical protein